MSAPPHATLPVLPTAELHVHIEGTLEPELAFALAARNGRCPEASTILARILDRIPETLICPRTRLLA